MPPPLTNRVNNPLHIFRQSVVDTSTLAAAVAVEAKSVIVNIQLGVMADGSNYTLRFSSESSSSGSCAVAISRKSISQALSLCLGAGKNQ